MLFRDVTAFNHQEPFFTPQERVPPATRHPLYSDALTGDGEIEFRAVFRYVASVGFAFVGARFVDTGDLQVKHHSSLSACLAF